MRAPLLALTLAATPALAQSPRDTMFPGGEGCYLRNYTRAHLAGHPDQRVTEIALGPWAPGRADPRYLVLTIAVSLRGEPGLLTSAAYCENEADHLFCGLEGDAGSFVLEPPGTVPFAFPSPATACPSKRERLHHLSGTTGDDRVFLLPPVPADSCP